MHEASPRALTRPVNTATMILITRLKVSLFLSFIMLEFKAPLLFNGLYTPFGSSMVFTPPSVPPLSGDRNVIGGQKRYRGTETLSGDRNPKGG